MTFEDFSQFPGEVILTWESHKVMKYPLMRNRLQWVDLSHFSTPNEAMKKREGDKNVSFQILSPGFLQTLMLINGSSKVMLMETSIAYSSKVGQSYRKVTICEHSSQALTSTQTEGTLLHCLTTVTFAVLIFVIRIRQEVGHSEYSHT